VSNVGYALASQTRYADALPYFERSLATFEKSYGRVHPVVADAIGNVAAVLTLLGRTDEARTRIHETIDLLTQLYGKDSPNLQQQYANLAQLEHSSHHDADAQDAIGKAIAIDRRPGADPLDLAGALEIEGDIEHATHDAAAATRAYHEAIDIFVKSGGEDNAEITGSLVGLGDLAEDAKNLDEAEADFERADKIAKAKLGPTHRDTLEIEGSLAEILLARHRYADAHAALTALLPLDEQAFGPDYPAVAVELVNDAHALEGLGKVADARVELARALAIREKAYGADDETVGEALEDLAADDRKLGHAADAKAEAQRAATIASAHAHH